MTTRTLLSDDATYQQLLSPLASRSETFIISKGHRRSRSDHGSEVVPAAAVESVSDHRRLSNRLSLDTRPTASTSQRPRVSNHLARQTIADDVDSDVELETVMRGGSDDCTSSGTSSDESVPPERDRRPQSAWNSRSGRRPQFTFTDLETPGGDDPYDDRATTRCKPTGGGGSSTTMTPVEWTTPKRTTKHRASHIPVRIDRLHPASINNHADDRPRRHSDYDIASHNAAAAMLDLSRDQEAEDECASGRQKSASPREPVRRRSLADDHQAARMRALARLAASDQSPDEEMTSSVVSRRPHKLDPIMSPNVVDDDDDLLCHDDDSTSNVTSPEVDFHDVTSGGSGDANRREGNGRLRPAVSRKAKALLMM